MVFSSKDKILIKNLVLLKRYSSRRLIKEFAQKGWNKNGLDMLLRKIWAAASVDHKPGSGRPRSVHTRENINTVHDLVLSQENAPQTHRTTRQIERETGVSWRTVGRIIHDDLRLKCPKKTPCPRVNNM